MLLFNCEQKSNRPEQECPRRSGGLALPASLPYNVAMSDEQRPPVWYLLHPAGLTSIAYDELPESLPISSAGTVAAQVEPNGSRWPLLDARRYSRGEWQPMNDEERVECLGAALQ